MDQLSERTVEILDRKYEFVVNSSADTFMLDLQLFVEFVTEDELLSDFSGKLKDEMERKYHDYERRLKEETKQAIEIKTAILEEDPKLDDSDLTYPSPGNFPNYNIYEYSFAYFNAVVEESKRTGIPLTSDPMDDKTDVHILLNILRGKIQIYEGNKGDGTPERQLKKEIKYKFYDLEKLHTHTHLDWINYCRISPGIALFRLFETVKNINPVPEDDTAWREMSDLDKMNAAFSRMLEQKRFDWVKDATYGVISKFSGYSPANLPNDRLQEIISDQKRTLKRVYEAIRQEIGTIRLQLQLLDRYRTRCHWYNQGHLRSLVLNADSSFKGNREDILTRDLALYLFDQGISVLYRQRIGKHEIDLVELDAKHPMFIEAKAYKDSNARAELLSGISQLHAYLSSYDAHRDIKEAYYVMYRLGGPIYEFPRRVATSRFTMYPILVDLGLSEDSGRKQPKPIIISDEEVLGIMKEEAI